VSAMGETEPNERCAVGLSRTGADALGRPLPVIRLSASKRDRELIAQMKANCVAFAQAIARESRIVSAGRCNVGAAPFSRGRHLRHGSRR
jgi:hypothetical protein